jgi:uncharacterized membrane protein YbhN (UPF0104 family)
MGRSGPDCNRFSLWEVDVILGKGPVHRKFFSLLFLLIILGVGALYYRAHSSEFHIIYAVSVKYVILLSFLQLLSSLFYALRLKIIADYYHLDLNFFQLYGLFRAASFSSLVLPLAGGATAKAYYLKKFHNLKYSSFVAMSGLSGIIAFVTNGIIALLLLAWIGRFSGHLPVVLGLIVVGGLAAFLTVHRAARFPYYNFIREVGEEWENLKKDVGTISRLILVSLFIFCLSSLQMYVAFRVFSIDLPLVAGGVMAALAAMTSVVKIVPGDIGVRETIMISIAGLSGVSLNGGVNAALLSRIVGVAWTLLLTPVFLHGLTAGKKSAQRNIPGEEGEV